ncbi:MAG: spoIIIJ-associated protein, partial [Thermotoga sp.]|nr:spoIIIJ-associated protein [Thermotoga sp.]
FLNRLSDTKLNVILDMGDYREKRKKSLEKIVEEAVKKAISEKTKVVLDPMFSFERKIVHKLVRKHRGVISYSVGVEPYRRVVIEYSGTRREGRRKHDIKESI